MYARMGDSFAGSLPFCSGAVVALLLWRWVPWIDGFVDETGLVKFVLFLSGDAQAWDRHDMCEC